MNSARVAVGRERKRSGRPTEEGVTSSARSVNSEEEQDAAPKGKNERPREKESHGMR